VIIDFKTDSEIQKVTLPEGLCMFSNY